MSRKEGMDPLIIGGVGGGGTRVYKEIAEIAGISMLVAPWFTGLRKTQHDNWLMRRYFFPRWLGPHFRGELSAFEKFRMRKTCEFFLWLCAPLSYRKGNWGWKNPNNLFFIPFFASIYPAMRFVHVIRDGRHHAFHKRFRYADGVNRALFSDNELGLDASLKNALFWSRCNKRVRQTVEEHLSPDRYLVSRFEDLCIRPRAEVRRILLFLGNEDEGAVQRAADFVRIPESFESWRNEPAGEIAQVERLIGTDLESYGYELTQAANAHGK